MAGMIFTLRNPPRRLAIGQILFGGAAFEMGRIGAGRRRLLASS